MTGFHSSRRNDVQHMERLATSICSSLGRPPRPLPSRVSLAIEGASRRIAVIAGTMAVVLLAIASLSDAPDQNREPSVIAGAMNGTLPRAEDVYAWARTISVDGGR
jgi:hypothetical protein